MLNISPIHEFIGRVNQDALADAQGKLLANPLVGEAFADAANTMADYALLNQTGSGLGNVAQDGAVGQAARRIQETYDPLLLEIYANVEEVEDRLEAALKGVKGKDTVLFAASGLVTALYDRRSEVLQAKGEQSQETIGLRKDREPLNRAALTQSAGLFVVAQAVDYCAQNGFPMLATGFTRSRQVAHPENAMLVGVPTERGLTINRSNLASYYLALTDVTRIRHAEKVMTTIGARSPEDTTLTVDVITGPSPRRIETAAMPLTGWTPMMNRGESGILTASNATSLGDARHGSSPFVCVDTLGNAGAYRDVFEPSAALMADALWYRHGLNFPAVPRRQSMHTL